MVCPVCVAGGTGFILSRIFGFPGAVSVFYDWDDVNFDGILGKSYLDEKMEQKKGSARSD